MAIFDPYTLPRADAPDEVFRMFIAAQRQMQQASQRRENVDTAEAEATFEKNIAEAEAVLAERRGPE